jgi:hypothetical protein
MSYVFEGRLEGAYSPVLQRRCRLNYESSGDSMVETVYLNEVHRGLKSIARFLDCHPRTVLRLHQQEGLPLKKEGGNWTLTTFEYQQWRSHRR